MCCSNFIISTAEAGNEKWMARASMLNCSIYIRIQSLLEIWPVLGWVVSHFFHTCVAIFHFLRHLNEWMWFLTDPRPVLRQPLNMLQTTAASVLTWRLFSSFLRCLRVLWNKSRRVSGEKQIFLWLFASCFHCGVASVVVLVLIVFLMFHYSRICFCLSPCFTALVNFSCAFYF